MRIVKKLNVVIDLFCMIWDLRGRNVMSKFESIKVLKSRVVYSGPNRRLVADTVEFADKSNY
jgi:hypothetical protein